MFQHGLEQGLDISVAKEPVIKPEESIQAFSFAIKNKNKKNFSIILISRCCNSGAVGREKQGFIFACVLKVNKKKSSSLHKIMYLQLPRLQSGSEQSPLF